MKNVTLVPCGGFRTQNVFNHQTVHSECLVFLLLFPSTPLWWWLPDGVSDAPSKTTRWTSFNLQTLSVSTPYSLLNYYWWFSENFYFQNVSLFLRIFPRVLLDFLIKPTPKSPWSFLLLPQPGLKTFDPYPLTRRRVCKSPPTLAPRLKGSFLRGQQWECQVFQAGAGHTSRKSDLTAFCGCPRISFTLALRHEASTALLFLQVRLF